MVSDNVGNNRASTQQEKVERWKQDRVAVGQNYVITKKSVSQYSVSFLDSFRGDKRGWTPLLNSHTGNTNSHTHTHTHARTKAARGC